jgi:ribosomal protein S18 acetylase RimI-like enzyme
MSMLTPTPTPWTWSSISASPGSSITGRTWQALRDEPTGFAYGAPLQPGREWWRSTSYEPNNDYTATFAVSEVMVRSGWRKQGIAERLHEALLSERSEELAVLLVDVTHPKVQDLYESWGYAKVGEQRPFADSPLYAVMLEDPLSR